MHSNLARAAVGLAGMSGIPTKLPGHGISVFAAYAQLAVEHQAVNLGQGFPDFSPDAALLDEVAHALHGGFNQYAPLPGLLALREAISELHTRVFGATYDPETEITLTAGATEALFTAFQALIHPGDEVILFEPAYDSYRPAIELAGGVPVPLPLTLPSGAIDFDRLQAAISSKTKAVVVNSPHNPTGTVLPQEAFDTLARMLETHNLLLLSDEVYGGLRYDGTPYAGVGSTPGLRNRSLWIGSFGKSLHATGWKLGYVLAPPALTAEVRKVHQYVVFAVATPLQQAVAQYLPKHPDFYAQLAPLFERKRNLLQAALAHTPLEALPCSGTYFQCYRYPRNWGASDDAVARRIIQEAGVVALPLSPFYHSSHDPGLLRFCFAKREATLLAAGEKLRAWAESLG